VDATDHYYSASELFQAGFRSVGSNVRISRKSSLYSMHGTIGDNVRVDDFCILKGSLNIGSFVHISAFSSVSGTRGTVTLCDFSGLANRVSIYTGSDDYSADSLSNPTVPQQFVTTISGDVVIGRAALIGAHSVVLPGVTVGDAASVGALCIVSRSVPPGVIAVAARAAWKAVGIRSVANIMNLADQVSGA